MGLNMTAADLCSSYKPWHAQRSTVSVIMEEFFQQVIESLHPPPYRRFARLSFVSRKKAALTCFRKNRLGHT